MERSNLYGFLATVFRSEATPALIRHLRDDAFSTALNDAGVDLGNDFHERTDEDLCADLAVEYTRLFIGPGKHVSPYAAVYLGGEGASLWGPSTIWVQGFITDAGFDYQPDSKGLPDHIAVELEFLQGIAAREAAALESGDENTLAALKKIETAFIQEHLSVWLPKFRDQVVSQAESPFYREMANLAANFIETEKQALSD